MTERSSAANPALTGIRGAAALWVYLFHLAIVSGTLGLPQIMPAPTVVAGGYLGVDLFFILSGFILMSAHARDFQRPTLRHSLVFYSARMWRVYPPSFAALLGIGLLLVTYPPFGTYFRQHFQPHLTALNFLTTAGLATRWGLPVKGSWNEPVWSLSVEILAYAVFPVLAWIAWLVRGAWATACLAIGPLMLLIDIQHFEGGLSVNFIENPGSLIRVSCGFVGGVFLQRLCILDHRLLRRSAGAIGVTSLILIALVLVLTPDYRNAAVPLFAGLILACASRAGIVYRLLSTTVMVFLGSISFPFYLLHLALIVALGAFAVDHEIGARAYLAITVALTMVLVGLSWVMHVLVEKPAHRQARRWVSRQGRRDRPDCPAVHCPQYGASDRLA